MQGNGVERYELSVHHATHGFLNGGNRLTQVWRMNWRHESLTTNDGRRTWLNPGVEVEIPKQVARDVVREHIRLGWYAFNKGSRYLVTRPTEIENKDIIWLIPGMRVTRFWER